MCCMRKRRSACWTDWRGPGCRAEHSAAGHQHADRVAAPAEPARQSRYRTVTGSCQFVEQRLRLSQIGCGETFGEPAVDRREEIAGFGAAALVTAQPGETHGGAQFEELGLLAPADGERRGKGALGVIRRGRRRASAIADRVPPGEQLTLEPMQLRLPCQDAGAARERGGLVEI